MKRFPALLLCVPLVASCASDDDFKVLDAPPWATATQGRDDADVDLKSSATDDAFLWTEIRFDLDGKAVESSTHYDFTTASTSADLRAAATAAAKLFDMSDPPKIVDCEVVVVGGKVLYEITVLQGGKKKEVLVHATYKPSTGAPTTGATTYASSGMWTVEPLLYEIEVSAGELKAPELLHEVVDKALKSVGQVDYGAAYRYVEALVEPDAATGLPKETPKGYHVKTRSKLGVGLKLALSYDAATETPTVEEIYTEISASGLEIEQKIDYVK
jgi:hypothetical protein